MPHRSFFIFLVVFQALTFGVWAKPYSGHGRQSVSPTLLQRFAPTPLPDALTRRIQSALDLRPTGLGMLSEDGKNLYFTWAITGTSQAWTVDSPLAFPSQLTGGEEWTHISGLSPDGKYLILSRDRHGQENPGLYLQRSAGGPVEVIQHQSGIQTFFAHMSDDSKTLYFLSNDMRPDSYAIYRFDIESRERKLIFDEPGLWYVADVSDGKFLLGKATGSFTSEFFVWDEKSKALKPLLGQSDKEEYQMRFGARVNEFLVLTNRWGNFNRLYSYVNGEFTPIGPEMAYEISSFSIDQSRQRILYQYIDEARMRFGAIDAKTFREVEGPSFDSADQVFAGFTTLNGRYTTFGVESATMPRQSFVYDWRSRKLTKWLRQSTPEIELQNFVPAALEFFPARDGTQVPMFVRRPAHCLEKTCPVVVHFHGGPESFTDPGFSPFAQLFVDAGFVFVGPNVRGSDGYGKEWRKADDGAKRLDVITDIEDCAKFIRTKWSHDGKTPRIGVMGWSYGGYSTLMAMTYFAGAYDAGVALVGMSDLRSFLANTAPYRRTLRDSEYGSLKTDSEILKKLSPISYLERLKDPLLIIQGANDPRVPVGEAIQIYDALKKKKSEVQLILFPDEGHGTAKRSNRVLEWGHTLLLFEKHLK